MLIYMLNQSRLPWSCLANQTQLSFTQLLLERTREKYIQQLYKMCPVELLECLSMVLNMSYEQEPPYDDILRCLQSCFDKAVQASQPSCLPSRAKKTAFDPVNSYKFEWNRTLGNRFRDSLIESEQEQRQQDVNVSLIRRGKKYSSNPKANESAQKLLIEDSSFVSHRVGSDSPFQPDRAKSESISEQNRAY